MIGGVGITGLRRVEAKIPSSGESEDDSVAIPNRPFRKAPSDRTPPLILLSFVNRSFHHGERRNRTTDGSKSTNGPNGDGGPPGECLDIPPSFPEGTWANGSFRPQPEARYIDLDAVLFSWYAGYFQDKQVVSKKKRRDVTQAEINDAEAKRRAKKREYGPFYSSGNLYQIANGIPLPKPYRVLGEVAASIVQAANVRWKKKRQALAETRAREEKESELTKDDKMGEIRSESDSDSLSVSSFSRWGRRHTGETKTVCRGNQITSSA